MDRYRYFKSKIGAKFSGISEWKLDNKNGFKPYPFHVMEVEMNTGIVRVYSHFYMTMVKFGKSFELQMSQKVFRNLKEGGWKKNWIEVPHYRKNKINERRKQELFNITKGGC